MDRPSALLPVSQAGSPAPADHPTGIVRHAHPLRTRSVSLGASIVVHALLLALAAAVVWRVAEPSTPGPPTTITFDAPQLGDAPTPAVPPILEAARPHEAELHFDTTPTPVANTAPPIKIEGLSNMKTPASAPAPALSSSLTGGAAGRSTDTSNFSPDNSAAFVHPVTFAGLGASNARSVVYVVDCSGSMVTSLPFVIAEVERSVNGLSPTQKFGVVLFRRPLATDAGASESGVDIFAPILVRATESARQRLHEWLAAAQPSGRSAPLLGLERAVAYKPDAVFLLSRSIERSGGNAWDSGLSDTLARVDALNPVDAAGARRPVLIQTIQFLDDDPTGIMQEIGRLHGSHSDASGASTAGYRLIKRGEDLGGGR